MSEESATDQSSSEEHQLQIPSGEFIVCLTLEQINSLGISVDKITAEDK